MNRIFLMLCAFFTLITSANAGELYHCIDSGGNEIITDTPQDGMEKCVLKDSYRDPTPQERAQQQKSKQESYPAEKRSAGLPSRVKVTVKRIGNDLYEDIFTHIVIKTAACVELALMDEAILDAPAGIGELLFLNTGMSCMVVKVYRQ